MADSKGLDFPYTDSSSETHHLKSKGNGSIELYLKFIYGLARKRNA
uniref:Uncharacterized protein n=1 Tax=Anguilla anguilla TaxID=7936 RepID=A0A0E9P8E3_ANGAN